jgi:hypothetical protein
VEAYTAVPANTIIQANATTIIGASELKSFNTGTPSTRTPGMYVRAITQTNLCRFLYSFHSAQYGMPTVYHHDVRITKVLASTLFIVGAVWFLLFCLLVVAETADWLHLGFEGGMFFAAGIIYGPVLILVGALLRFLLKQYESRRSAPGAKLS